MNTCLKHQQSYPNYCVYCGIPQVNQYTTTTTYIAPKSYIVTTDYSKGYQAGISYERNRIISLIPDYMKSILEWGYKMASKKLIKLIEGKTNES